MIKDDVGIWVENRDIVETIIKDFQRRFTSYNNIRIEEGIPFSRDIDEAVWTMKYWKS